MAIRTRNKLISAISLALMMSLIVASLVMADDISNKLDDSVDAIAEVMSLNVGGAGGTTQLYVVTRNGDGKNGCNLTGSTTLVVSVSSSNTSVATVVPDSITFSSCGDTPSLTVTPRNQGSATISVSQVSNNTNGSFNLAPATFTVDVAPPPNTPPQVSVNGVEGGASYNKGSVPTATCQVTDAEDGNSSFTATLSAVTGPYSSDGIGEQTASCSYTDGGGLTAAVSVIYVIVDPSAPSISYELTPGSPDGNNGWYKSDVTLTWNVSDPESPNSLQKEGCVDQNIAMDQSETTYKCSAISAGGSTGPMSVTIKRDATAPKISGSASPVANEYGWNNTDVGFTFQCADSLSGVASCGPDQTLSSEGAGQSATGTAVDNAGNSASTSIDGINIDKTAPTISAAATTSPNGAGWYNKNVTVAFACADGLAGIPDGACPADQVLSDEGAAVASTAQIVTDKAGNTSDPSNVVAVKIDKTTPGITWNSSINHGDTYYFGFVPSAPTCTATDALSGPDGCNVIGYATTIGPHTLTATAQDVAGNQTVETRSYTVLNWMLSGFYQPVDMNGVYNLVKNGSTVPLKFEIFAGATELTDLSYVKSFTYAQTACEVNATTEEIETTATGGTSLRYDTTAGQFVYNWKTPNTAGKCYRVTMTTLDGSSLIAYFKLK